MKNTKVNAEKILEETFRETGFDITNDVTKKLVIGAMVVYARKVEVFEGAIAEYWHQRSKLADAYIDECVCDPDITPDQLKAWEEYQDFIND